MRAILKKNGKEYEIHMPSENSIYLYAQVNGFSVVSIDEIITPTIEDDINAITIDHEYRLTLLELGLNE